MEVRARGRYVLPALKMLTFTTTGREERISLFVMVFRTRSSALQREKRSAKPTTQSTSRCSICVCRDEEKMAACVTSLANLHWLRSLRDDKVNTSLRFTTYFGFAKFFVKCLDHKETNVALGVSAHIVLLSRPYHLPSMHVRQLALGDPGLVHV